MTGLANLLVPEWEYARTGNFYQGGVSAVAAGIAPVADFPTVTAGAALYNNNDVSSSRTIVVTSVGFFLSSGTAAAGAALVCTVTPQAVADAQKPVANTTSFTNTNLLGSRPDESNCLWKSPLTIPTSIWVQVGSTQQLAAANLGQGYIWYPVLFMVPVRCAFGISVISGTGTSPLYAVGARFAVLPMDLTTRV